VERADILRDLVAWGTKTTPERCTEVAADLGLLTCDVLTIAGHPVPAGLLPPQREARVMREFAYCASHCDHVQMAALIDFIRTQPVALPDPSLPAPAERKVYAHPDAGHFAVMLDGLLRNRGFGPGELPFTGLSLATIYHSMLTHDLRSEHRRYQLGDMAGPLGRRVEDLIAVASGFAGSVRI
jgi:hypothetical protein